MRKGQLFAICFHVTDMLFLKMKGAVTNFHSPFFKEIVNFGTILVLYREQEAQYDKNGEMFLFVFEF